MNENVNDKISVLVADDDQSLLKLVLKVLGREGFEVEGFTSGREVLERARQCPGCLLLLDFNLPDMSGGQVVEELAASHSERPFIVMTGQGDERIAVDMMKLGARDYVMKDVAFVDLLPSVVGQALEQIRVEEKLKNTEAGLQESEEKFAKAFRSSPDWHIILTIDDGRIVEANDAFFSAVKYGRGEVLGTSCRDLDICVNASFWKEMFDTLSRGRKVRNRELLVRIKSGEERSVLLSAESMEFSGEPCAICVAHDITERKRDQERILESLREKEVLLKEIHHRVKNNLQVITSLLNLQSRALKDEGMKTVFEETGNRVKSMALVHEMLYGADDFSNVDLGSYASALIDSLYRICRVSRSRVEPALDMGGLRFGIDYAVPCGLILNELASNSLKYAFPGEAKGRIAISAVMGGSEGAPEVSLIVEDDGVGLPDGMDFASSETLGMKLVRLLSERQLEGTVTCTAGSGTRYEVVFPMRGADG